MNLLINVYYTGVNGNAKRFANEMVESGLIKKIRREVGNLKYEYYYCYDDNETILLVDKWLDQESLDKHHESVIMKEISKLRNKYNLTMKVEKYLVKDDSIQQDSKYITK